MQTFYLIIFYIEFSIINLNFLLNLVVVRFSLKNICFCINLLFDIVLAIKYLS